MGTPVKNRSRPARMRIGASVFLCLRGLQSCLLSLSRARHLPVCARRPCISSRDSVASVWQLRFTGLDLQPSMHRPRLLHTIDCTDALPRHLRLFLSPAPTQFTVPQQIFGDDRFPNFVIASEAKLFAIPCFFRLRRRNQCASTADAITRAPAAAGAPRHKAQGTKHKALQEN